MGKSLQCPICQEAVPDDGPAFPFCSPHCKAVDLSNWLDGTYTGEDETDEEHAGLL